MKRRNFLASLLALPTGLVAAAKACAKPWFIEHRRSTFHTSAAYRTGVAEFNFKLRKLTPIELEKMYEAEVKMAEHLKQFQNHHG